MGKAPPMVKTATPGVFRRGRKYVVTYRDRDGKQRKETVFTLKEAKLLKNQREVEARGGAGLGGRTTLFHDYAERWCSELFEQGARRERTSRDYARQMERHVLPYFRKTTLLSEVTAGDVDRLITSLRKKKLSPTTARRILVPFRMCMEQARRDGLIESNPVDNAKVPRGSGRGRVVSHEFRSKALTRRELALLLEEVPDEHRLFFRTLAATGARWSEAIAWQKKDFDAEKQILKVRRTLSQGVEYEPKTHKSKRDIPLSPQFTEELTEHLRTLHDDDLIFSTSDNQPLTYDSMKKKVLDPAALSAGAYFAGFHTFRHTAASILFDNGCNIKEVQEFLGHSTPGFTLNTYVHLMPDSKAKPVDLDREISIS